jgi:hypothetical protein
MHESATHAKLKTESFSSKGKEPCSVSDNKERSDFSMGWEPPPEGWTKINVDGSFVEQSGAAGVGVIARDDKGTVIFTAWCAIARCESAYEAEALACLEGLKLASQWASGSVILETDCVRVLNALRDKDDKSEACFVIEEARHHANCC